MCTRKQRLLLCVLCGAVTAIGDHVFFIYPYIQTTELDTLSKADREY
jgi:hypothetical protein